jgi:hypothetical protein
MAVKRGVAAEEQLTESLMRGGTEAYPFLREPLPGEEWSTEPADSPLWKTPIPRSGLCDPGSYELGGEPELLHRSPHDGLSPGATPGGRAAGPEDVRRYCRASVDLTMRGGTTSGVVYPLAVCEIARELRIRNVGGASAGAIAASATAAAELGRMTASGQPSGEGPAGDPSAPPPCDRSNQPGAPRRFRPGFAGMAESLGWLTQTGEPPGPYEYRLAQLFRPTQRTRPLFRVVVAAMRHRWWALPVLAVTAFGPWSAALTIVLVLAAPLLVAWLASDSGGGFGMLAEHYGLAMAGLAALTATAVAAALLSARIVSGKRPGPAPGLAPPVPVPTPVPATPPPDAAWALGLAGLAAVGYAVWGLGQDKGTYGRVLLLLLGVWLPLGLGVLAVLLYHVYGVVRHAKSGKFGLVSGATTSSQLWPAGWRGWAGRLSDLVAGMPPRTEDRALVHWLSDTLNDLAGLPDGEVLRFGHLWVGGGFSPRPPGDSALGKRVAEAAGDARRRRVNLELITTELVHSVPYRFPLPSYSMPQLYFRKADLATAGEEVFPPEVIAALTPGQPLGSNGQCPKSADGEEINDLYPLPDPWDLPVIFAVRLSLSLPGLFQAVRLYAARPYQRVREDFGLGMTKAGEETIYPSLTPSCAPPPRDNPDVSDSWFDELWFSDGGITSDFPIHFFDAVVPAWPTLGINLGSYPAGYEWQDVWLPQDWQPQAPLPTPLADSMLGFVSAIVNTARGWHDTLQTFLPGFRSRVAWVRQGTDEGGSNLFMSAQTIASLALRGQFAGARLRRRFTSESHWQRHQWVRLRIALDNLSSLRRDVAGAIVLPPYPGLLDAGAGAGALSGLETDLAGCGDPVAPEGPEQWYQPARPQQFWEAAQALATALKAVAAEDQYLSDGVPEPEPDLKQSPPV